MHSVVQVLVKKARLETIQNMIVKMQRDAINETLRYASKNRLPEGIKEQMLAHLTLRFKTAELQQEGVLEDLPKALRSSISQHLFRTTLENTYLFKGVSEDFLVQLVMFSYLPTTLYACWFHPLT